MTETELQAEVERMCAARGLLYHHCARAVRCVGTPGLPDLIIAGEHGVIFAELKSEDGETSAVQDNWLWTLQQTVGLLASEYCAGYLSAEVWRPCDAASGYIATQLEAIR